MVVSEPNAVEAAERILALFREQKARPGHTLKDHFRRFPDGLVQLTDFKAGRDYAASQGWIKLTDQFGIMLTERGFSACH